MHNERSAGFVESEEWFHATARDAVGYDDFGDDSYLEGLRVLLGAYDGEARLHAAGREAARWNIVEILKKRLRAERAWKQDPSLLAHPIRRPLIILGLVRTGSTALHHLMGQDPGFQVLPYWLAANPQPRPPRDQWSRHPDFRAAAAEIDAYYQADPSLKAIHFMSPDGPEECRHLLAQSFTDDSFEVNATLPSYSEWYEKKHLRDTYRRHRDLIRLIGATDPERRWLLKYPVHMRHLRALLEVYPDACIVQTHRDPKAVFSSYVSLIAGFRSLHEDRFDAASLARRQLELWARGAERAIEVRRQHDPLQFFDLHFEEFVADPIGSVRRIYDYFGQPCSEEGERRLHAWSQQNPQHKHGRHEHASRDVGIRGEAILERFAGYMEHFGMTPEDPR